MLHYREMTANALKGMGLIKVKKDKTECSYYDIEAAFDIEATSYGESEDKQAFMYIWMLGIGKDNPVYYGRTWGEFLDCISRFDTSLDKRLVIYVHNLAYEFQFMKPLFTWESVFSIGERTPIKALTDTGIEFRDNLVLSGVSLEKLGSEIGIEKGKDLEYSKIRHHKTPLTKLEMGYCEADIRILTAYIAEQRRLYGNVTRIPATNTGRVRKYVRDECYYTHPDNHKKTSPGRYKDYREMMVGDDVDPGLQLSLDDYKQLKRAFAGGYTHANRDYKGQTLENVTSFDLVSAYPAVMLTEQFPMSAARQVDITGPADIEELMKTHLVLFDMKLIGVVTSVQQDNYLSASRCWELSGELLNNGRVYSADSLCTTVTDVDYRIIQKTYTYTSIDITNVRIYKKGYLPKAIMRSILNLYQDKVALKGVPGKKTEYNLAKSMLNSVFGMTVTDVVQVRNLYTTEWTQESDPAEEQVKAYNKSEKRFLYYPWGVWITAYARQNLWSAILEAGNDYVYSDTDSIKLLNVKEHYGYMDKYNALVEEKLLRMNEIRQFDEALLFPNDTVIGIWEKEGTYDRFKTLGPKRYLTEKKGKYSLTLAGLPSEKGLSYLQSKASNAMSGVLRSVFDEFHAELKVPEKDSGKLLHTYIDTSVTLSVTDCAGITASVQTTGGVHLMETGFTLSLNTEVEYVVGTLATEGNLKGGTYYDGN